MNQKLSGAQMVFVPITKIGDNKFPWVENIRSRFIKYIDFYGCRYLPGTQKAGLTTTDSMFVTIKNAAGNTELVRNLPLARFDYTQTLGIRQPIFSNIALSDCVVNCQNEDAVGTVIGRLEGKNPNAPVIMTGSHFDTVKTGGKTVWRR